jgi:hypothetical protein
MPAVPVPMTATSTCSFFMLSPSYCMNDTPFRL